ncbi:MAG: class I tRNA ligase family protein, partial [bacterium]|nr:class I tRNA ligase family protein [bacterium]
ISPIKETKQVQEEAGKMINSGFLNGLDINTAKEKIKNYIEEKGWGKRTVNYKLRDWVFSRQHYWGEPIPVILCSKCGIVPISEKDLPVKLPNVKSYEPTDNGESPLANIKSWVNAKCPKCKGPAKRETDTMPNWAGSSWYFLRYTDPKNDKKLADLKKLEYWMPVDLYNGGMEHTTLHLLYSRFWNKFLYDIGVSPVSEAYAKRHSHGIVLAEDGRKMSKSFGNVVNPDDCVKEFGADTLRLYELFMGPFEDAIPWNAGSVIGMKRFLDKVWKLESSVISHQSSAINNKLESLSHKTIKKVTEDIENFRFNTAISALMILANEFEKEEKISIIHYSKFIILLSPFAPHIAEEIWEKLGHTKSIFLEKWPSYDPKLIKDGEIELVVQANGKLRDRIKVSADISEEEAKEIAMTSEKLKKYIAGKEIRKIIFVKGRLINIVI